jgi:hypothetical protein
MEVGMHGRRRRARTALIGSFAAGIAITFTTLGLAATPSHASTVVKQSPAGAAHHAVPAHANWSISGDALRTGRH